MKPITLTTWFATKFHVPWGLAFIRLEDVGCITTRDDGVKVWVE